MFFLGGGGIMVDTSASALCQTVANSFFGETRTDTDCVAIVWIIIFLGGKGVQGDTDLR